MFRTIFDKEKKLWLGAPTNMNWIAKPSLGSQILSSLDRYGSRIAQICAVTGSTKTFEELRTLTVRAAMNLRKFGCEHGRKIFLFSDNITDFAPLAFASICLACPLVCLVTSSSQAECEYFINITRPDFVICEMKHYSMLNKCYANLKIHAEFFTMNGQAGDSISTEILFQHVDNESDFV